MSYLDLARIHFAGAFQAIGQEGTMPDSIMEKPTWESPIRSFFNDIDINHMRDETGLDLADYEDVKANAEDIARVVDSDFMPLDPSPKWTQGMKDTFRRLDRPGHAANSCGPRSMSARTPTAPTPVTVETSSGVPATRRLAAIVVFGAALVSSHAVLARRPARRLSRARRCQSSGSACGPR